MAIANEEFVRQFFPGHNRVGSRIRWARDSDRRTGLPRRRGRRRETFRFKPTDRSCRLYTLPTSRRGLEAMDDLDHAERQFFFRACRTTESTGLKHRQSDSGERRANHGTTDGRVFCTAAVLHAPARSFSRHSRRSWLASEFMALWPIPPARARTRSAYGWLSAGNGAMFYH